MGSWDLICSIGEEGWQLIPCDIWEWCGDGAPGAWCDLVGADSTANSVVV